MDLASRHLAVLGQWEELTAAQRYRSLFSCPFSAWAPLPKVAAFFFFFGQPPPKTLATVITTNVSIFWHLLPMPLQASL